MITGVRGSDDLLGDDPQYVAPISINLYSLRLFKHPLGDDQTQFAANVLKILSVTASQNANQGFLRAVVLAESKLLFINLTTVFRLSDRFTVVQALSLTGRSDDSAVTVKIESFAVRHLSVRRNGNDIFTIRPDRIGV